MHLFATEVMPELRRREATAAAASAAPAGARAAVPSV
jgi:hypothetical protein